MEFLLLWADELDDAIGALKHLTPKLLGLAAALVLFAATGYAVILTPHPVLAATALALSAVLFERIRRRRIQDDADPAWSTE